MAGKATGAIRAEALQHKQIYHKNQRQKRSAHTLP
jgi:hypothetical protein